MELGAPDGSGLLGDLRALIEQLGSGEAEVSAHGVATPLNFKALTQFLETYKRNVLIPHEWPAIYRAYLHARQGECHELIALDQSLPNEKALAPLADASHRIGQFQLSRLGRLRGERVLARYIAAIDEGRAHGWHTLVYGLTLAIYSLPARQGLMHYAHQILRSYLESGAAAFSVNDEESNAALESLLSDLPRELDKVLNPAL